MTRTIHITEEPVILSGFNAILKPSKFGYSLKAVVGEDIVNKLEEERKDCLDWAQGKLSCKPNRATLKPTPWEEVYPGKFIVKFSWKEENKPPVVDTEGTLITNEDLPVYEGSQVKIGFTQKPYILRDGTTYGTSLKLSGVQIVKVQDSASLGGDLDEKGVADLFGKTEGFKDGDIDTTEAAGTPASVEDDF
jgi:hypothetical protein